MRGLRTVIRAAVDTAAATVLIQPAPGAAKPPGIPSSADSRAILDGLTVAAEGSAAGYSRDEFPHWRTVSDGYTAREAVLQRDGTAVEARAAGTVHPDRWQVYFETLHAAIKKTPPKRYCQHVHELLPLPEFQVRTPKDEVRPHGTVHRSRNDALVDTEDRHNRCSSIYFPEI